MGNLGCGFHATFVKTRWLLPQINHIIFANSVQRVAARSSLSLTMPTIFGMRVRRHPKMQVLTNNQRMGGQNIFEKGINRPSCQSSHCRPPTPSTAAASADFPSATPNVSKRLKYEVFLHGCPERRAISCVILHLVIVASSRNLGSTFLTIPVYVKKSGILRCTIYIIRGHSN